MQGWTLDDVEDLDVEAYEDLLAWVEELAEAHQQR